MTMLIRLVLEGTSLTATLDGNVTARDFMSLLPLSLTLEDYAATEKIAYLPRKLATDGAPTRAKPAIGDVDRIVRIPIAHRLYNGACALAILGVKTNDASLPPRALDLLRRAIDAAGELFVNLLRGGTGQLTAAK